MTPKILKLSLNQRITISLAILAIIVTIIVAFVSGHDWFITTPKFGNDQETEYVGRVIDNNSQHPIDGAKVALDLQGVPPIVYTDSEGVYRFNLAITFSISGQIRVYAQGYEVYTRNIMVSPNMRTIEDVRLSPQIVTFLPTTTQNIILPAATLALALSPTPTLNVNEDPESMVSVPAGEFMMGSNNADDEKPTHKVYLNAFWIDETEVTNAMYDGCVREGKCQQPQFSRSAKRDYYYGNSEFDNYPVILVSWNDAYTYCAWANRRLPTEAEWEKAARGIDGRIYPWGGVGPSNTLLNYNSNVGDTTEVGKYPDGRSLYGALDMGGNVWEWTADWYDSNYYSTSPTANPTGPTLGQYHVLRGGSWFSPEDHITVTTRETKGSSFRDDIIGFRCARSEP